MQSSFVKHWLVRASKGTITPGFLFSGLFLLPHGKLLIFFQLEKGCFSIANWKSHAVLMCFFLKKSQPLICWVRFYCNYIGFQSQDPGVFKRIFKSLELK